MIQQLETAEELKEWRWRDEEEVVVGGNVPTSNFGHECWLEVGRVEGLKVDDYLVVS